MSQTSCADRRCVLQADLPGVHEVPILCDLLHPLQSEAGAQDQDHGLAACKVQFVGLEVDLVADAFCWPHCIEVTGTRERTTTSLDADTEEVAGNEEKPG